MFLIFLPFLFFFLLLDFHGQYFILILFFTLGRINRFRGTAFFKQLPLVLIKFLQILGQFVLMDVVHPDGAAQHIGGVQVVHGQDGAPLVHVAEKSKTFAFSGIVVTDEINVNLGRKEFKLDFTQE